MTNALKWGWLVPVLLLLTFCSNNATATHLYGGELQYTHSSGNLYNVTLTLYGDCSGQNFDGLKAANPTVRILNNFNLYTTLFLTEDLAQRKEVSPVCPEDVEKTTCKDKVNGTLPGVTRFVYTGTANLPPSSNWQLIFTGEMNNNTQAGRSNNITNIIFGVDGQLMALEARLNNMNGHNSSPNFTSLPTPFYCINRFQQYNQGAVDPDNDSLTFSLVNAIKGDGGTTQYAFPFSGSMPLASSAGTFNFDKMSGQLSFQPNVLQRSLVVNKVEEYKDGVLVGSSMREMTFIILNNCNNTPPTGKIDSGNITGGASKGNTVNVCANTPDVQFVINASDADSDRVTIDVKNLPQGATATVSNAQQGQPQVSFSWNTQDVEPGNYNFFITYTDDACPLYSSQTIAYTVNVVDPMVITHEVIRPTNCIFRQHIALDIRNGIIPRKVTVRNSLGTILSEYRDTTGVIVDSFKPGTYTVFAESEALQCKAQYTFNVEHSGTYPVPPEIAGDIDHCIGDAVRTLPVKPINDASINWYDIDGLRTESVPTYNTDRPGIFRWLVSQQVGVCESVMDTLTVTVHDYPDIRILNQPERICAGDGMYLLAEGGVKYDWLPEDKVVYFNDSAYTYVRQATTYSVKGYSRYGCANTDTITYDNIEQCCTFSYPTAFTPNGDGINDGWRPVTYGNMDFYLLSVYNRWGQRVYISSDPRERWDGSFKGKACEMDTYHYYLRAKCVTGGEEETKGSFILVR